CEACALAKRRCDGAVTCSRCSKYSVPCVYRKVRRREQEHGAR
ncbi:unnamed protein product, partial [Hapterophycus canaliculatus]